MNTVHTIIFAVVLTVCSVASENSIGGVSYTTLESLDDFSLMSIFDELKLRDLLNVAALSPRFKQLVYDHYLIGKFRFHERRPTLSIRDDISIYFQNDVEDEEEMLAYGFEEAVLALQSFCHLFSSLEIKVGENGFRSAERISSYVNQHCGHVSQKVEINRSFLETGNLNLLNAVDVQLIRSGNVYETDELRMDLAFPRMEKLHIGDRMNLNYHYPSLTEFTLEPAEYVYFNHIKNFIQSNSQLRRVRLPFFFDCKSLNVLNEALPHLDSLSLFMFGGDHKYGNAGTVEDVRFKNLKEFSLNSYIYDAADWTLKLQSQLESIQFGSLESFSVLTNYRQSIDFFIEWIVRNTELTHVSFTFQELSFGQLNALVEPLSKLEVLTITWKYQPTLVELNRFLTSDLVEDSLLKQINVDIFEDGRFSRVNIPEFIPTGWSCNATQNPVELYRTVESDISY